MNTEVCEYIKSITMPAPGCKQKKGCAHFYKELRLDDESIYGEFCIRFEDWDEEIIKAVVENRYLCGGKRERGKLAYAFIECERDVIPGILDLNKIFGGI